MPTTAGGRSSGVQSGVAVSCSETMHAIWRQETAAGRTNIDTGGFGPNGLPPAKHPASVKARDGDGHNLH